MIARTNAGKQLSVSSQDGPLSQAYIAMQELVGRSGKSVDIVVRCEPSRFVGALIESCLSVRKLEFVASDGINPTDCLAAFAKYSLAFTRGKAINALRVIHVSKDLDIFQSESLATSAGDHL